MTFVLLSKRSCVYNTCYKMNWEHMLGVKSSARSVHTTISDCWRKTYWNNVDSCSEIWSCPITNVLLNSKSPAWDRSFCLDSNQDHSLIVAAKAQSSDREIHRSLITKSRRLLNWLVLLANYLVTCLIVLSFITTDTFRPFRSQPQLRYYTHLTLIVSQKSVTQRS